MRIGLKHAQDGRFFPLQQKGDTVIGSSEECTIVLDDESVAPKHARIRISDLGIELDGLAGKKGTAVNGYATAKHLLSNGDVIQCGTTSLALELDARSVAPLPRCRRCNAEPAEPLVGAFCRACAARGVPRRMGSSTSAAPTEFPKTGSSSRPGSSSLARTVADAQPVPEGALAQLHPHAATKKIEAGPRGIDPTLLDPYVPIGVLGEGSQGRVYKLRNRVTGQVVAGKHLLSTSSSKAVTRFEREIKALQSVRHPSIVGLIDVRRSENTTMLLMEHVEGASLGNLVRKSGPLAPHRGLAMAAQIVDALACIAALKIVHRDIKPSNILVTPNDAAKLLDFGLVRFEEQSTRLTAEGQWIGTPHYMAPEQISGNAVDARSDIWGVGTTFFFALTGKLPFDSGTPVELFRKITGERPDMTLLEARAGREVVAIFDRMLAKRPDERPSIPDLIAELQRLARAAGARV